MNLSPYFDVNQTLPGERDPEFKGYVTSIKGDSLYRRFYGVNASLLKHRTLCEMYADMTKGEDAKTTDAKTIGTLLHWAVLEPWRFDDWKKHMVPCETKSVESKNADDVRAENPGKLVVTPEMINQAERCRRAVNMNPRAMDLLEGCGAKVAKEVCGFVFDPVMGVWRKIKLDLLPADREYIPDVKTTTRHPSEFIKDIWQWGYHKQAAWYLDTHHMLTGERRKWWVWIVVTKEAKNGRSSMPPMCRVVTMENYTKTFPLYKETILCKARERLGLDDGPQLGAFPMWCNAAREHEDFRAKVPEPTEEQLRLIWSAYEQVEDLQIIT